MRKVYDYLNKIFATELPMNEINQCDIIWIKDINIDIIVHFQLLNLD